MLERSIESDSIDYDDPRQRALCDGLAALDDPQLVGVVLGRGPRGTPPAELGAAVLDHAGGLLGLARFGPSGLLAVPGLGAARALRLAASIEISQRIALRAAELPPTLPHARAVAELLTPRVRMLDDERMWVLALDARNRLRSMRRVAQGGVHALSVTPADILRAALCLGGVSFVLAHNHPSGSVEPSGEDIETTTRVAALGDALGVPLLDHVIVTRTGEFASLLELGLLDGRRAAAPRGSQS